MMAPIVNDPALFEVFRNAVTGIADEMSITVLRTAHSQIVAESYDFSTALCDPRGRLIAQANTLPLHLGSIPEAMEAFLHAFGDSLEEGDAYILNDPDLGGMHLPDIFATTPVFHSGELIGFSVTVANHTDVGGAVAGSMGVQAETIFAEGLQLPPIRLYSAGILDETLKTVIQRNVREPDLLWGDLQSQLSACHTGAQGLRSLVDRHGMDRFHQLIDELLNYSETLLRSTLAGTPDGSYVFEDFIDDDGISTESVPLRVEVTVAGDTMHLDFTGSAPQVRSAINATPAFTKSAGYAAIQAALGRDIPANSGFYRPISFNIPQASVLNGQRPSARGARGIVGFRLMDTIFGALHPVFPDRIPAAGDGGPNGAAIGITNEDGSSNLLWDILCGAWGAGPDRDGVSGVSPPGANLANTPVEVLEGTHKVRVDAYGFVPDSGGVGRWRGGMSTFRDITLLHERASLQIRSDRRKHRPYGLEGGGEGGPSMNILTSDGEKIVLPTKPHITIKKGDSHRHITAGGGGFGDPLLRDPWRVLEDVLEGKVTIAGANEGYGVVIDDGGAKVDEAATIALRSARTTP